MDRCTHRLNRELGPFKVYLGSMCTAVGYSLAETSHLCLYLFLFSLISSVFLLLIFSYRLFLPSSLLLSFRLRFRFLQLAVHRKKKVRKFPVPRRDVTTKLSQGGNNDVITELFPPRGSLVSDIPAGDGKLVNLFLRCTCQYFPYLILSPSTYKD